MLVILLGLCALPVVVPVGFGLLAAAVGIAVALGDCVLILAGCGSDAYVKRGTRLVEFATDGERVQQYLEAHR